MRTKGKSIVRSSHDLILVVGAALAIAMIVSAMVHNWKSVPKNFGANTVAVSRLA
jgi:hypothetical protein